MEKYIREYKFEGCETKDELRKSVLSTISRKGNTEEGLKKGAVMQF